MGRTSVIKYGDIVIESDEPMREVEETLSRVMTKWGYPSAQKTKADDKKEFEEELQQVDEAIAEEESEDDEGQVQEAPWSKVRSHGGKNGAGDGSE